MPISVQRGEPIPPFRSRVIAIIATFIVPFRRVTSAWRCPVRVTRSSSAQRPSTTANHTCVSGKISPFVNISGTLTGDGVGYPNNTNNITCHKDLGICLVSSVEQIGFNQVGRLDSPTSYDIKKWDSDEIIAPDDKDPCNNVTVSILLRSEVVAWGAGTNSPAKRVMREPQHQNIQMDDRKFTRLGAVSEG